MGRSIKQARVIATVGKGAGGSFFGRDELPGGARGPLRSRVPEFWPASSATALRVSTLGEVPPNVLIGPAAQFSSAAIAACATAQRSSEARSSAICHASRPRTASRAAIACAG